MPIDKVFTFSEITTNVQDVKKKMLTNNQKEKTESIMFTMQLQKKTVYVTGRKWEVIPSHSTR